MIELGAGNLDALDGRGDTALILASGYRNVEMVKLLHEAKADLNACGRYGTALHRAADIGHTEMLKVTRNELTTNASDRSRGSHCYWPFVFRELVCNSRRCPLPLRTLPRFTVDVAQQTLIELGANNWDAVNKDGMTALTIAKIKDRVEMVDILNYQRPTGKSKKRKAPQKAASAAYASFAAPASSAAPAPKKLKGGANIGCCFPACPFK